MPSNAFSKEEIVAYEQLLEGFDDALVLSNLCDKYVTDQVTMERTNDVIWRPMPYIMQTFAGSDMTTKFQSATQLTVPATIGFQRSAPWVLTARELRDALQERRLTDGAKQRLASDINLAITNVACLTGTVFVRRTTASTGFDDVALCDSTFNELGVSMDNRKLVYSSRDYNGAANNLANGAANQARSFGNDISDSALRRANVGVICNFDTYKADYVNRITAAAGAGITINTTVAGGNFWVPKATSVATTGEMSNVDNRFQRVTVNSTASVKAGDAFTIGTFAGGTAVEAVHLITKQGTGQLKTFRVISVDSNTTMTISPPIISNQGGSDAEAQYQNCIVNANAAAAITFLNTATASANPFFVKSALEILPGRLAIPSNAGAGVMAESTSSGFQLVMTKQFDIKTLQTFYRVDLLFGVVNKQPEMTGVMMFNQ
jgi:hypothetical protein